MQLTNGSSRISSLLAFLVVLIALPAIAVQATYIGTLEGSQEVPPVVTDAAGEAIIVVDTVTLEATWSVEFSGLSSDQTGAHFHNAGAGQNGGVVLGLPMGSPANGNWVMDQATYDELAAERIYINVHTVGFPGGEIRGQMLFSDVVGTESTTWSAMKALFR